MVEDPDGNVLSLTEDADAPLPARPDDVAPEIFVDE